MFLRKINLLKFSDKSKDILEGFILFGAPGAGKGTYGKLL